MLSQLGPSRARRPQGLILSKNRISCAGVSAPSCSSLGRTRRAEAADQFGGVDLQRGGQFQHVVQADVALSAFNLSDHRPVDAADVAEALLAPAESSTPGTNSRAELARRLGNRLRCHRPLSPYISGLKIQRRSC